MRQERWEAVTFTLLHGGLLLRVVAEPQWRRTVAPVWQAASTASGALLLAAIVTFALALNARVVTADTVRRRRVRREAAERPAVGATLDPAHGASTGWLAMLRSNVSLVPTDGSVPRARKEPP